jgi:photosystem II stability/assembly factor-like uncharacterized protein
MTVARRMSGFARAALLAASLSALVLSPAGRTRDARADDSSGSAPAAAWVNVTNDVGGDHWGAYGVGYVKAVPGSRDVVAGVSERGLWISHDSGATWQKLGGDEIKNRPDRIVFDPRDRNTFWESGCYGDAPFVTHDGGRTFQRLGNLAHADGLAIDFADRARRTLLLGMHEQSQSLRMSTDGGQTWTLIGDRLPPDSNHSSDPILLDSHTFLINTAGWKQGASLGIYRSTDAGATWVRVSTFGPAGEPLVAPDGAIYWQRLWGGGLLKSTDEGVTWNEVSKAVRSNVVAVGRKRLAGFKDGQVYTSDDGGVTWTPFGPPAPFTPNGIAYSEKGRCFYIWQLSDNMNRQPDSIARLGAT